MSQPEPIESESVKPESTKSEAAILMRKLDRERTARAEAERLLEVKSLELFKANEALEALVEERTTALRERLVEVEALRAQLEVERDAAVQESAAKTLMFAKLSHEIRTPMNGVFGAINFLTDLDLPAKDQHWINVARTSISNLRTILNNAIDLARLEEGVIALDSGAFSIKQLLRDIHLFWEHQLSPPQKLFTRIDKSINDWVVGDAGRVRQIIDNYISNAIKYGGKGAITLSVDAFKQGEREDMIRFSVSDEGTTLPFDKRESLFEPYNRNLPTRASSSSIGQGVGLGLAICRELAELMGGTLGVEPAHGGGNRFFFLAQFPAADRRLNPRPHSIGPTSRQQASSAPTGPVLIVEDVPTNQMVLERYLDDFGYRHETAENGLEAVEMVKARGDQPYACILMDIAMPVMDGYEASRAIRSLPGPAGTTAIIGVSAHVGVGETNAMREAGMLDGLGKPIEPAVLEEKILSAIHGKQNIAAPADDVDKKCPAPALIAWPDWVDETLKRQVCIDVAKAVAEADQGLASDDAAPIVSAFHKLKSLVGTFGLPGADEIVSLYEELHYKRIALNDPRLTTALDHYRDLDV